MGLAEKDLVCQVNHLINSQIYANNLRSLVEKNLVYQAHSLVGS